MVVPGDEASIDGGMAEQHRRPHVAINAEEDEEDGDGAVDDLLRIGYAQARAVHHPGGVLEGRGSSDAGRLNERHINNTKLEDARRGRISLNPPCTGQAMKGNAKMNQISRSMGT